jgi:phosphatidylglycerophosphatase A
MSNKNLDTPQEVKSIVKFIVTFGYSGLIKPANGTFGTIFAILFYYICGINTLPFLFQFIIESFLFSIGYFAINIYIKDNEDKDPSEIVIDEAVAIMFALTIASTFIPCLNVTDFSSVTYFTNDYTKVRSIFYDYMFGLFTKNRLWYSDSLIIATLFEVFLVFLFFRVFDIFKITPASYFDKKVKGATGVMMDDVIAACYSIMVVLSIVYFATKFYKFVP